MNDSIGSFINWIRAHKYIFVTVTFLLIIVFFDENNLIKHVQNQHQIAELKAENEALRAECEELKYKFNELHRDLEITEKVAREKYGMHKENEEVFIIED